MPPASESDHLPAVRAPQGSDVVLRKLKKYLLLREDGKMFHESLKAVDLQPQDVYRWRSSNPQFKDAERNAIRAGVEFVERKLRDAARQGEPWAVDKFLKAHAAETYGDKVLHEHVLDLTVDAASHLSKIATMKAELERRRRDIPASVLDDNPFIHNPPLTPDDIIVDAEIMEDE